MRTLGFLLALVAVAVAAPPLSGAEPPQERSYVVTLENAQAANDPQAVAADLAKLYGGRVEEGGAGGSTFVMRLSESRARLIGSDPRVHSVTPFTPAATATIPAEVVAWTGGVSYTYDGAGNVRQIGKDTFAYDHVGRLVEATVNGIERNYEYDAYGNRKRCIQAAGTSSVSDCQGYTIDSGTNRIAEAQYDPAGTGTVTTLGIHNYSYDEFMMLKRDQSAVVREFVYTATDERIAVYDANSRSWQWTVRDTSNKVLREFASSGGAFGTQSFTWKKDYVWRDGRLLASRQPEGSAVTTYHYHLDHLGTPRRVTDDNDNLLGFHDYFAFGPEVSGGKDEPSLTALRYTGHERDRAGDAFGTLDYMHARYYNPALGRFLSLDPGKDWDPSRPQSWNLYTYVRNDPMNALDPTGRWGWRDFVEWIRDARQDMSNWWHRKWHDDIPAPADPYDAVAAGEAADLSPEDAHEIGNPQARWANARAEAGAIVTEQATEEAMAWGVGKVVGAVVAVTFSKQAVGHGARHLAGSELAEEVVEEAIENEIQFVARNSSQTGSFWGRITVEGQTVQFKAFTLPDGTINVGTYWVIDP